MTAPPTRTVVGGLADLRSVAMDASAGLLLLVPDDLVASPELDADLVARRQTVVATSVTGADDDSSTGRCVVDAGRVVAVGTAVHGLGRPGPRLTGPLVVSAGDRSAARVLLGAAVTEAERQGWPVDAFDLAVLALVRGGIPVSGADAAPYVVGREPDLGRRAGLARAAADQDVVAARWRRATRGDDGLVSTALLRPLSRRLSPLAVRAGATPDALTAWSLVLALFAAGAFAFGARVWLLAGVVLALVSIVLDCADGEVARFTRRFTRFGAWFDAVTDRVKELALLLGLAIGAVTAPGADTGRAWVLAVAALAVQTVRHASRFAFVDALLEPATAPQPDRRPLVDTVAPRLELPPRRPPGAGLRALTPGQWLRRVLQAPVSERYAVLVIGVLGWGPEGGIVAYLGLGVLSLAWTSIGWLRRTVRLRGMPDAAMLHELRDDGVLGRRHAGGRGSRWCWVLVPAVTALEGTAAVLAATFARGHAPTAALVVILVLLGSWRRYEVAYGTAGDPPAQAGRGPGWPVRLVVLVAVAGAADAGWLGLAAGLAAALAAWQGASAVVPGVHAGLAARRDPGDR